MSFPLFVTANHAISSLVIRWKLYISSVFYSRHIALVIYCGDYGCRHTALGGIALNLWSKISKKVLYCELFLSITELWKYQRLFCDDALY